MTDHDEFAQPFDPARQTANLPAPQPGYGPPQYPSQPPSGYQPNPYGPQGNGHPAGYPAGYGAQPYAPAYGPQYGVPAARTANGAHVAIAWIFAVLTFAYMLPWAIAATRAKSNAGAIAVLNFFVGWTVIGWIAALVMACSAEQAPPVVIAYPQQPPYYPPPGY